MIYVVLLALPNFAFARSTKYKITPMNSDGCARDIRRDVCGWKVLENHLEKCEPSVLDKNKSIGILEVTVKESSPKSTEDLIKRAIEATGRKIIP